LWPGRARGAPEVGVVACAKRGLRHRRGARRPVETWRRSGYGGARGRRVAGDGPRDAQAVVPLPGAQQSPRALKRAGRVALDVTDRSCAASVGRSAATIAAQVTPRRAAAMSRPTSRNRRSAAPGATPGRIDLAAGPHHGDGSAPGRRRGERLRRTPRPLRHMRRNRPQLAPALTTPPPPGPPTGVAPYAVPLIRTGQPACPRTRAGRHREAGAPCANTAR